MANYNQFNDSYAGIISAFAQVRLDAGEIQKYYPPNYQGIIDAILDMNKAWSGATPNDYPPGWDPVFDDDGNVIGGGWLPGYEPAQGNLWFDERQGRLMVYVDDAYYQANGADVLTRVQNTQPEPDVPGAFWYNPDTSDLYIFDGTAWILVSTPALSTLSLPLQPSVAISGTTRVLPSSSSLATQADLNSWVVSALEALDTDGGVAKLVVSSTAPSAPGLGATWFDSSTDELKVWDGSYWKVAIDISTLSSNFNTLNGQVAVQDAANATRFTTIENSVAALPLNNYALTTALDSRANTLQSNIDTLTTNVGDLSRFALATELANTINNCDTRLTALEGVTIDLTPFATSANVNTQIAGLQTQITANAAKADVSYVDSEIATIQATIPSTSDFVSQGAFSTYQGTVTNTYLPKSGGALSGGLVLNNLDNAVAKLNFTTSHVNGRKALSFKSYANTESYVDFGITDDYWEYAFEFGAEEDFCWKHATNGKQFSINKNGATAKNLIIADFIQNDATGQRTNNAIDVKAKLNSHDTAIATHTQQINEIISGAYTNDSGVIYSDTAPIGTIDDGAIWFDSQNIRLNVRHQGAWIYPDRVEDTTLKQAMFNAVSTATDFETLRIKLLAALI